MPTPTNKTKRRWRLPRWSMATMFIGVTIFCVVFGLVVRLAEEQKRAVEALREVDGVTVYYDYEYAAISEFKNGSVVAGLPGYVGPLPGPAWLRELIGIDYFADVVAVESLGPQIRDDDLRQLRHFSKLEALHVFAWEGVTDDGLEHLKSLKNLKVVWLYDTKVTKEGVANLQRALPNCEISSDF